MKLLWRTLIILLAAAVVTGATLGAMQLPAVQTWVQGQGGHGGPPDMAGGEFGGRPTFGAEAGAEAEGSAGTTVGTTGGTAAVFDASAAPGGDTGEAAAVTATASGQAPAMRGEGGHNNGGNLAGLVEVAKNLGIVVAVSLAIGFINWGAKRLRPRRPLPAATV